MNLINDAIIIKTLLFIISLDPPLVIFNAIRSYVLPSLMHGGGMLGVVMNKSSEFLICNYHQKKLERGR
jgi:hypothetical protein